MQKQKNNSAVIGLGLVATVAAVAGAYFLYGSKSAIKNRKSVKSWTLKAKGEILEQLENMAEVNEEIYHTVIKEVSEKYQVIKEISEKDIAEFTKELRDHWKSIEKEIKNYQKKSGKK